MRNALVGLGLGLALAACDSSDPADGGFFNGVAGATGGGYDQRIAEREAGVAQSGATNAALSAELAGLRGDHAALKRQIIARRAEIRAAGGRLSAASEARIQTALAADPNEVAALRQAIADARALAAELAAL
jgi:hypothetical protein